MCGRYTLTNPGALARTFGQFRFPEFSENRLPRYNVAPAQDVLGVRNDGRNAVEELRWGIAGRINARAETIAARRYPIRRRCIEFADGFYEWRDGRPFYFTLASREPFAFAGLWESGDGLPSCNVVTCAPNALVAPVHDRMPVILTSEAIAHWLDPEPLPPEVAASLLRPYDAGRMCVREVSRKVNNANYDASDVLGDCGPPDASELRLF